MAIFQDRTRGFDELPECGICGCKDVRVDYFDGDVPLELGECPRCSHRWTQSMLEPARVGPARPGAPVGAGRGIAARILRDPRTLPHAA